MQPLAPSLSQAIIQVGAIHSAEEASLWTSPSTDG
jgi:hypothetical protein